jgi:CHAT domain-containing protein
MTSSESTAPVDLSDDSLEFVDREASRPGVATAERAAHLSAQAMVRALGDGADSDGAVASARAALAAAPVGDAHRVDYLTMLGYHLIDRYEQRRDPADLSEAVANLERARALAGSPAHRGWSVCSTLLAHCYLLAGRASEGLAVGLDGLRGHVWSVLLQADLVARTNASRDAGSDAIDVARWFLNDNQPAGAAAALDAGRSLMLFAATEHRTVGDRLLEQGETDLADRWRLAAGTGTEQIPVDLRQEVFGALTGLTRPTATTLLDPPTEPEVQATLRTLGLDALVYLVPGDTGVGAAVIVSAQGATSQVLLPRLNRRYMPDLTHVASARPSRRTATRDVSTPPPQGADEVYDWAWTAVVAPVLRRLPTVDGRLPRIALVPMRELALVPWHAARCREEGRVTYAIEHAVISYALSARLLRRVAEASPLPTDGAALIVADPDTGGAGQDLISARAEAWAVRECHYPDGLYIGRTVDGAQSPSGAGRSEEILAWLADSSAVGSVLHLACHGVVDAVPATDNPAPGRAATAEAAYLLLHQGTRLAAEQIVATMTGSGRPVGLVVLAACNSGVAARGGHDETFSLAATFLVGGARTVVGTQWSVPDGATSLLMFMFHRYLRDGLPPLDALHRAQLWMIADDRAVPAEMPSALRQQLKDHDPSDIDTWAGFIHLGQ